MRARGVQAGEPYRDCLHGLGIHTILCGGFLLADANAYIFRASFNFVKCPIVNEEFIFLRFYGALDGKP